MRDEAEVSGAEDDLGVVPSWVLPFFQGRSDSEVRAWWEAAKRLYGPSGVRMDFRAVAHMPQSSAETPSPAAG